MALFKRWKSLLGGYKVPIKEAIKIMSPEHVLTDKVMAQLFNVKDLSVKTVNYSPEKLEQCAEENRRVRTWLLMCRLQLSLYDLRALMPHEFCPASAWHRDYKWLRDSTKADYRLISVKLMNMGSPEVFGEWPLKEKAGILSRAHVSSVAQAAIALKFTTKHRMLKTGFHVCNEENLETAFLGGYQSARQNGMLLYTLPSSTARISFMKNAGIIVCLNPGK